MNQLVKMDNYYCLIKFILPSSYILYLFDNRFIDKYPLCLASYSSNMICDLIDLHDVFIILSVKHTLYLGKELYKAEICSKLGQKYIQN